jgi:cyclic pyranopterin phosphate synthase
MSDQEKTKVSSDQTSLTHFNAAGRAQMVDVSAKSFTDRRGVACGEVLMQPATLQLIREGRAKKGDVLAVAQVAGIMAAKKTHEIIPMCHPLLLTGINLSFDYDESRSAILIEAEVKTNGQTGVEMEALTAVSAAALTIYDMVKAVDRAMQITNIRLVHKSGGKSGDYNAL